ncbi:nitrite reductase/ring-hydroxylating ferredoxin subunit [Saccharothrix tamanrassetensis]|uniref:Nitrite reductase/ring-hydroxylating ferredoxin subunit n=1 Tax=Saccharothrix tamanrassetensis TaxID=1051531 RepID=A0A841CSY0_9PSEU|nr:Rieske (2Fe-2S) protein [Saccharothrix tamanrassetensis]MBB5959075.1 nitrite reductase/ring-hydroxylating ferredoxin subunit [Saccharothrix tamanrassetensis]
MERRTLLLCGLLALTGCGSPAAARQPGVGSARTGDRVAGLADVPEGSGALVPMPGDGQLLVVRSADGVRVFNPACPHQGTVVDPPAAGVITCPTHRSAFDPTSGAVLSGPSPKGLAEVPVRVSGEDIVLA